MVRINSKTESHFERKFGSNLKFNLHNVRFNTKMACVVGHSLFNPPRIKIENGSLSSPPQSLGCCTIVEASVLADQLQPSRVLETVKTGQLTRKSVQAGCIGQSINWGKPKLLTVAK